MFFIFKGEGKVSCDGKFINICVGDSIFMLLMGNYIIENIGFICFYVLCIMVLNEDFVELICSGKLVDLDEEDI